MEIVGIFLGPCYINWDENTVKNGMGGSETWAHEISLGLAKRGYEVFLYAYPEKDHDPYPNYHLVSYEQYFTDIHNKSYDHFIFSRITTPISPILNCNDVYMMIHDVCMITPEQHQKYIGLGIVDKYCYLSDWHKEYLLSLYGDQGLDESRLYKVSNGYSREFYQDIKLENKENSIIWSSSLTRGFNEFYTYIYLPLLKKYNDIKLYVCCGTIMDTDKDLLNRVRLLPGVCVLDKLSKEQLAEYQKKSSFWVYPGSFAETFCITSIENAAAGNVLITPLSYGLYTTLKDIGYLHNWDLPILDKNNANLYISLIENMLNDENIKKNYQMESLRISQNYNWDKATEDFINLFNS